MASYTNFFEKMLGKVNFETIHIHISYLVDPLVNF